MDVERGEMALPGDTRTLSPGEATWQGPDGDGEVLTIRWNKEPQDVSVFAKRWDLPQVVRLAGSRFQDFGENSPLDVHQPLLLYNVRRCTKLLANCVKWDPSSREYTEVGHKIVVPLNYPGWFTFLQDRGKSESSYRTIEAVSEAKLDAFLAKTAITAYDYTKRKRTGEKIYYKVHIPPGEIFTVGSWFETFPSIAK